MSERIENKGPPVGEFYIADDGFGNHYGWGQVLGSLGGGYLLCTNLIYRPATRKIVPPDTSKHWRFFETQDECAEALALENRRKA